MFNMETGARAEKLGGRQCVNRTGGAETQNRRQFRHEESRKTHGESARLKNKGARGAKRVGGKE